MRPVSLSDAIFFNLGDRYITSVCLFETPLDPRRLRAELADAAAENPALREKVRRRWPGFVAALDPAFDIDRHIAVMRAPEVVDDATLVAFIDRLRRVRLPKGRPPWRAFVINPEAAPGTRSAVAFHFKHGLSDGMGALQAFVAIAGRRDVAPAPRPVAEIAPAELFAGRPNPLVDDAGIAFAMLNRRRLTRAGDGGNGATGALVEACAAVVADDGLIDAGRPTTGRIAHTRVLMRRRASEASDLGNHLETAFTETRPQAPRKPSRFRLPGIERAQTSSWSQHLVAKAPPPIARLAMRIWISRFDAMISLIPGPTRAVALGGAEITAVFGVPPLSGPIPLAVAVITYAGTAHLTVIPGKGARVPPAAIAARLVAELEARADTAAEAAQ